VFLCRETVDLFNHTRRDSKSFRCDFDPRLQFIVLLLIEKYHSDAPQPVRRIQDIILQVIDAWLDHRNVLVMSRKMHQLFDSFCSDTNRHFDNVNVASPRSIDSENVDPRSSSRPMRVKEYFRHNKATGQ